MHHWVGVFLLYHAPSALLLAQFNVRGWCGAVCVAVSPAFFLCLNVHTEQIPSSTNQQHCEV